MKKRIPLYADPFYEKGKLMRFQLTSILGLAICTACSLSPDGKETNLRTYRMDTTPYEAILSCRQNNQPVSGVVERYYDGEAFMIDQVYQQQKRDSLKEIYHPKGIAAIESTCRDGVLDGPTRTFYENGNLKTERIYRNGLLEGIVSEYYENGILRAQTPYQNGVKEGLHVFYKENKDVQGLVNFHNDIPESGVCITTDGQSIELTRAEIYNYVRGAGLICP